MTTGPPQQSEANLTIPSEMFRNSSALRSSPRPEINVNEHNIHNVTGQYYNQSIASSGVIILEDPYIASNASKKS